MCEDNHISLKCTSSNIPHTLDKFRDASLKSNIRAQNHKEGFLTKLEKELKNIYYKQIQLSKQLCHPWTPVCLKNQRILPTLSPWAVGEVPVQFQCLKSSNSHGQRNPRPPPPLPANTATSATSSFILTKSDTIPTSREFLQSLKSSHGFPAAPQWSGHLPSIMCWGGCPQRHSHGSIQPSPVGITQSLCSQCFVLQKPHPRLFCCLAPPGGNSHPAHSNRRPLPAAAGKGKKEAREGDSAACTHFQPAEPPGMLPKALLYLQGKKSQTVLTPFGRTRVLAWNGSSRGVSLHKEQPPPFLHTNTMHCSRANFYFCNLIPIRSERFQHLCKVCFPNLVLPFLTKSERGQLLLVKAAKDF